MKNLLMWDAQTHSIHSTFEMIACYSRHPCRRHSLYYRSFHSDFSRPRFMNDTLFASFSHTCFYLLANACGPNIFEFQFWFSVFVLWTFHVFCHFHPKQNTPTKVREKSFLVHFSFSCFGFVFLHLLLLRWLSVAHIRIARPKNIRI